MEAFKDASEHVHSLVAIDNWPNMEEVSVNALVPLNPGPHVQELGSEIANYGPGSADQIKRNEELQRDGLSSRRFMWGVRITISGCTQTLRLCLSPG